MREEVKVKVAYGGTTGAKQSGGKASAKMRDIKPARLRG
jgi:hypothetical protein